MAGDDHGQVEPGIEQTKLLLVELGQGRCGLHVDVAALGDPHEVRFVLNGRKRDAVFFRLGHDALDGLQARNVVGGFARHAQTAVAGRPPARLVAADGARNAALAPVVGRQRELPVAELVVKLSEVVKGRARAFKHVAALVLPEVLLQREDAARRRNELPQPCGLGVRERLRLEGAFNKGQQRKLGGKSPSFDLLDDVVEIAPGALKHRLGIGRIARVLPQGRVDAAVFQGRHGKSAPDAIPDVHRRRNLGLGGGKIVGRARLGLRGLGIVSPGRRHRVAGDCARRRPRGRGLRDGGGRGRRQKGEPGKAEKEGAAQQLHERAWKTNSGRRSAEEAGAGEHTQKYWPLQGIRPRDAPEGRRIRAAVHAAHCNVNAGDFRRAEDMKSARGSRAPSAAAPPGRMEIGHTRIHNTAKN